MTKQKVFDPIFNADGNFVVAGYDPHGFQISNPEHVEFHKVLFDSDGNLHEHLDGNVTDGIQDIREYIEERFQQNPGMSPFCDAVKLYFAEQASSATCIQYSTASMWKR